MFHYHVHVHRQVHYHYLLYKLSAQNLLMNRGKEIKVWIILKINIYLKTKLLKTINPLKTLP